MKYRVFLSVLLLAIGANSQAADPLMGFAPDRANRLTFKALEARFIRLAIPHSSASQPCIDELEIYGDDPETNLALASLGAKPTASSCLPGYEIHKIAHLNDGRYGNSWSWIAAGSRDEWAQIELSQPAKISSVVFSRDRDGRYRDRMPGGVEVHISLDGRTWKQVELSADRSDLLTRAWQVERDSWRHVSTTDHLSPLVTDRPAAPGDEPYWSNLVQLDATSRALLQLEQMIDRLAEKGLTVATERQILTELKQRQQNATPNSAADQLLYIDVRRAKRDLMFRDPALRPLERILFVRRHPYHPSHNYSDILDSKFRPGGGVCVLKIPREGDRLDPAAAKVTTLFDATEGIARDPVASFDASKIYFAFRPEAKVPALADKYWKLMSISADGSEPKQLTDGPFHDYYPCPLPDGGLAFISTRCRARFLCWRPQAFVLFRMNEDGSNIRPLSFANLSEWSPSVSRDGRILWTRSEYIDKGADFGHTLWSIRPDGTHPELVFGNNTRNCYLGGREMPDLREICCTIISHGGDLNGPIGLIDPDQGRFNSHAITNITPDVTPHYHMSWARSRCFRDPYPISRDHILVSHAPADRFGLYVIDRWGNRELLHIESAIGCVSPSPLLPVETPRVLKPHQPEKELVARDEGIFTVSDVYQGLEPTVERGRVKYIRVCQEVRAELEEITGGEFRKDHGPIFQDFYATPIHKVNGPPGWPSYVAKASLGLARVESDGSASFRAPAGRTLYFQALDADFNELQRMRSVIQLQPGERRSCVGCHEDRLTAPPVRRTIASLRQPEALQPPPWGTEPLAFEQVVQPVLDARCASCHNEKDKAGIDLTGRLDANFVPASYRTLIAGGWVHYFNCQYGVEHNKAQPLSFGTLRSRLLPILDAEHYDIKLTEEERHRIKCWIDMNCPLWGDYLYRPDRGK